MKPNRSSFVQINVYGKTIRELKKLGIDKYLISNGCEKVWMGEVTNYDEDVTEESNKQTIEEDDDASIFSTTVENNNFPRCSTPIRSSGIPNFTLCQSKALSKIGSYHSLGEETQEIVLEQSEGIDEVCAPQIEENEVTMKNDEQLITDSDVILARKGSSKPKITLKKAMTNIRRKKVSSVKFCRTTTIIPNLNNYDSFTSSSVKSSLDCVIPQVDAPDISRYATFDNPTSFMTAEIDLTERKDRSSEISAQLTKKKNFLRTCKSETVGLKSAANVRQSSCPPNISDPMINKSTRVQLKSTQSLDKKKVKKDPRRSQSVIPIVKDPSQIETDDYQTIFGNNFDQSVARSEVRYEELMPLNEDVDMKYDESIQEQANISDSLNVSNQYSDANDNYEDDEENYDETEELENEEERMEDEENERQAALVQPNVLYRIKCEFENCNKTYSWKSRYGKLRLIDHALTHIYQKQIKCQECGKMYRTTRQIREHYKTHHRNAEKSTTNLKRVLGLPIGIHTLKKIWKLCFKANLAIVGSPGLARETKAKRPRKRNGTHDNGV